MPGHSAVAVLHELGTAKASADTVVFSVDGSYTSSDASGDPQFCCIATGRPVLCCWNQKLGWLPGMLHLS